MLGVCRQAKTRELAAAEAKLADAKAMADAAESKFYPAGYCRSTRKRRLLRK